MQTDFENLILEGQEFIKQRVDFKRSNNPPAGSIGNLISLDWIIKYKKYIHYDSLCKKIVPQPHNETENVHPGPISNSDFLETNTSLFLPGAQTGQDKGAEPECIDRYIRQDASENRDYEVCSNDTWQFLSNRYGFDFEVRRYYNKGQWSYTSHLEISMKQVPIILLFTDQIATMDLTAENFLSIKTVQVRKSGTYGDLKKRIADCVSKIRNQSFKQDQIRLWTITSDDDLKGGLSAVAESLNNQDIEMTNVNEEGVEFNSGVDCPGGKSLEAYIGTAMTLEQKQYYNEVVLVEVAANEKFVFKYKKQDRLVFGKCEWCNSNSILNSICICKKVRYCDEACLKKDKRYHDQNCVAQYDDQFNSIGNSFSKSIASKNGCVGLSNLGNTCFMNSSLQCLSNTYELTKFFLDRKFTFINDLPVKNSLGTEGRLVLSYAKTINSMWNEDSRTVTPSLFKQTLGQYATQFQGYDQHDSHECINTILDLLGEDLYRKGKKPYIDMDEKEGQQEEEAAKDAWNRHLYRNESVITDLFHGQFKSTVSCSKCDRISITFDPMMTILLPIPPQKQKLSFFFVPYEICDDYVNFKCEVAVKSNDSVLEFRNQIKEKYGRDEASYTITKVSNNEFIRFFNATISVDQFYNEQEGRILICYETDPSLKAKFPQVIDGLDSNNGIDDNYTRLIVGWAQLVQHQYSQRFSKVYQLPRLLWANKQSTLKQLYLQVFKFFRQILGEWIDWKDPKTKKVPDDDDKIDLRESLIDFPYQLSDSTKITKEQFMAMQIESCFELCFPGVIKNEVSAEGDEFDINQMPYKLVFKNTCGYYEDCNYCGKQKCSGCPVPYTDDFTIQQILTEKLKLKSNTTLFSQDRFIQGKELQFQVVWHQNINRNLFTYLQNVKIHPLANTEDQLENSSADVQLTDCLREFKQVETLDEENMWYCNKCKEHVQATKTLEIFKLPRIMIISLKRFKQNKSRYSYSGGNQKLDTLVDFPLEGLDMAPFVLSKVQKEQTPLIYDLFAVSNHSGGVGGGHYTAYGQNYLNGQWYEFDDSNCRQINKNDIRQIVSEEAYSLFYRLRGHIQSENIDFDSIMQQPDSQFLQALQEHQQAKAAKKT